MARLSDCLCLSLTCTGCWFCLFYCYCCCCLCLAATTINSNSNNNSYNKPLDRTTTSDVIVKAIGDSDFSDTVNDRQSRNSRNALAGSELIALDRAQQQQQQPQPLNGTNNRQHDDSEQIDATDQLINGTSRSRRQVASAGSFNNNFIVPPPPPPPPPPPHLPLSKTFGPFKADRVDEVCGLSMRDMRPGRIVGGRSTYFGEVPFVVHLRESQLFRVLGFHKCGGVLINHKWALTAGHCKPAFYSSLEVILGKYKTYEDPPSAPNATALSSIANNLLSSVSLQQQQQQQQQLQLQDQENLISARPIDKQVLQMLADTVIVHPDYDAKTLENDLALVKFKNPVPYREDIQPICLPFIDEEFAGLDGYATGWGLTDFDKRQLPENLQIVRLPIMTNKRCQSMYKKAGHDKKITDHDLCAGYAKGGMDACEGDSGGPLIVRRPHDQRWVLAGIVSNGVKCGEPLLPGVYTRVSKFIPWIKEQIKIHS